MGVYLIDQTMLWMYTIRTLGWLVTKCCLSAFWASHFSVSDLCIISEDSNYKYNGSGMKTVLLRMLPEKHTQIGIFIAGPHIRMSLRKEFGGLNENMNHTINEDDLHLAFDVHNIAVRPTSGSDPASLSGSNDAEKECLLLKEHHMGDIPISDNEKYVSRGCISLGSYLQVNGLNAYVEDSVDKKQSQILELKPIIVQLSSFKKHLHSFGTTIVTLTAALSGTATGFTALSYMDELSVLFQVVGSLSSAVSHAYCFFDPIGPVTQEYIRQEIVLAEPEQEEIKVKGAPLICGSVLFKIYGTFKLESVDMVLHVSRRSDNVESSVKIFDALTRRMLAESGLSDCGIWVSVKQISIEISCKEQVEVLTDWLGIQFVIFRYQNHIGKHTDHSVLKDLLLQSLNWLYELSLSNCTITLITDSERPTHRLLINVKLGTIFMARCSLKNVLVGAHQLNKLISSASVASEFRTISWKIQGGFIFLETTTLAMFIRCSASYLRCVTNLLSVARSSDKHIEKAEHDADMTRLNDHSVRGYAQETHCASQQAKNQLMEAFIIDVSAFSIVLVIEEESGGHIHFLTCLLRMLHYGSCRWQ